MDVLKVLNTLASEWNIAHTSPRERQNIIIGFIAWLYNIGNFPELIGNKWVKSKEIHSKDFDPNPTSSSEITAVSLYTKEQINFKSNNNQF